MPLHRTCAAGYNSTMRDPRLARLAVLVNYSVGVAAGQLVRISGPSVAEPLIVELYRQTIAAGAHPFVQMTPDVLEEIFYKNGSATTNWPSKARSASS
jgi:leucyl aminopeptidase (aminopeptidase T)